MHSLSFSPRIILAAWPLLLIGLTGCGFSPNDPELIEAIEWSRQFKKEQPELMKLLAKECRAERGDTGFNRDAVVQATACVRRKYEAMSR